MCCWPEGLPFSSGLPKPNKLLPGHGPSIITDAGGCSAAIGHGKNLICVILCFLTETSRESKDSMCKVEHWQTEEATHTQEQEFYCSLTVKCQFSESQYVHAVWLVTKTGQLQITYCLVLLQQNQGECLEGNTTNDHFYLLIINSVALCGLHRCYLYYARSLFSPCALQQPRIRAAANNHFHSWMNSLSKMSVLHWMSWLIIDRLKCHSQRPKVKNSKELNVYYKTWNRENLQNFTFD